VTHFPKRGWLMDEDAGDFFGTLLVGLIILALAAVALIL
jgi:hypothetical protein